MLSQTVSILGDLITGPVWPQRLRQRLAALYTVLESIVAPQAADADRKGRYPFESIAALKNVGLMAAALPESYGGWGLTQAESQELLLTLAIADSSVAQIYKVHDDLVREIFSIADARSCTHLAHLIVSRSFILGQAIAENGKRADTFGHVIAAPDASGTYYLTGQKIYATGAHGADLIGVTSYDMVQQTMRFDLLLREAPGVTLCDDWNRLGQRATDSGTVIFDRTPLKSDLFVPRPGAMPPDWSSLRYQNGFSVILAGIAVAALREALLFIKERSRPWIEVNGSSATDDPFVRRLVGEIGADVAGSVTAVRHAAQQFDACASGLVSRAEAAMAVYAARSLASRASLRATSDIMSAMGARATDLSVGFDRYWRDARTLSLHDPVEWKHEEIGNHLLTGWLPTPGLYR